MADPALAAPGSNPSQNGNSQSRPDDVEEQNGDQIDNTVPFRAHHSLPVVALGGSAGSIPALRLFLENTPAQSGLAYVVVLHLAPDQESSMPALLQRHTAMSVRAAANGAKLEVNSVYVIPPGKQLTATDGHLQLTDLHLEHGKRVAVDLFFRSLAETHGPQATAVVLSGADGDGAIGLKRIKEMGGLTIAQVPEEAEQSSMPRSAIATGMVDWILPVNEMPRRIVEYYASASRLHLPTEEGPQPAEPEQPPPDQTETQLREILAFLRASTGRDFSYYKRATIVRRIARRMQVNSVDDLSTYLSHLRTQPGEAGALLQDLLISVTNFFRDRECFDALESHIPDLFRNKKAGDSVRVWVTACSTGEEAYSVAMLLQERARQLESPPKLQVFGCDLDEEAIQKARAGFYPETIAADVSEDRLRRFFVKESGGYRVRHELREMVLFAAHDLLKDAPFSRMDLVSCRNMLIYLKREAQARAVDIFHFALKPTGLLFLGSSESVDEGSPLFEPVDKKHRIYHHLPIQRTGLSVPTGAGAIQRLLEKHERLKQEVSTLPGSAFLATVDSPQDEPEATDAGVASDLHLKLLSRFGPPSVVVDRAYEIVHLSENANQFLQFPEGEPTKNVLRLVHPILRVDLRAALLRAAENDVPVEIRRRVVELPGGPETVEIRVVPAGMIAPGFILIIFEAHGPDASESNVPPLTTLEPGAVVQELERELTRANSNLRSTVEQYETSAEELKASNEELQAMNEELRSAGEELETSREELQSVNEELTTVNSELRSRLEELGRANSDLRNLMSATAIATVFLGRDLEIMRYTPSAAPLFNLIPGDVGRPIADLKTRLDYPQLMADAEQVLTTLVPIEREMRDDGHWFLARILPYRTLEDHIAGVVLTLVDITERRRAETALRESEGRFRGLLNASNEVIYRHKADWTEMQQLRGGGFLADTESPDPNWFNRYIPKDDQPHVWAAIQEAIRTKGIFQLEHRVIQADGKIGWTLSRSTPVLDEQGNIVEWFGAASDVTARREAEEALRHSEAWLAGQKEAFQAAVRGAPLETSLDILTGIAVRQMGADVGCAFYIANEAGTELHHVTGMPESYAECVDGFKIGANALACGLAVYTGHPVITPDITKDDKWREWLWLAEKYHFRGCWSFPIKTEEKVVGTLAMYFKSPREATPRDHEVALGLTQAAAIIISRSQEAEQRSRAEDALRASEERMRRAISVPRVGVLFFDLAGHMHEANAAFQEMCGYTIEELRSTTHWEQLTAPEFHEATKQRATDLAERGETPPLRKNDDPQGWHSLVGTICSHAIKRQRANLGMR